MFRALPHSHVVAATRLATNVGKRRSMVCVQVCVGAHQLPTHPVPTLGPACKVALLDSTQDGMVGYVDGQSELHSESNPGSPHAKKIT